MPRVGERKFQRRVQGGDQLDMLTQRPLQQLQDTGDHIVDVQHPWLDHLAAGESQQLVRQPGSPLSGKLDLLDIRHRRLADPLTRRLSQFLGDEGGIAGDNPEQVVEVMRDPAGELPKALQPLRLLDLSLQPIPLGLRDQAFPLSLGLHPFGDIADGGGD